LPGNESEPLVLANKGPARVSPHFAHSRVINLISGRVSIKYGLIGPNHAVVTGCSTGAHSIRDDHAYGEALKTIGGFIIEINTHMEAVATPAKEQSQVWLRSILP
jgi:hypothetical protein